MPKVKKINFEMIEEPSSVHEILVEMRHHHPEIDRAVIGLAWRKETNPDKDGHLVLGRCVKSSELNREFMHYDFIIVLNREVWEDPEFTDDKKSALMDHELCHAAADYDINGNPQIDELGRQVFRVRKHDIEEFYAIVARHGCYKRDLELFADALLKKRKTPLLNSIAASEKLAEGVDVQ